MACIYPSLTAEMAQLVNNMYSVPYRHVSQNTPLAFDLTVQWVKVRTKAMLKKAFMTVILYFEPKTCFSHL